MHYHVDHCVNKLVEAEPEFRPPLSKVVRLVQRVNLSKRTFGNEQRASQRPDDADAYENTS